VINCIIRLAKKNCIINRAGQSRLRYNYFPMGTGLILFSLLAALAAAIGFAVLRIREPSLLLFYYQLFRAQWRANRFYADCPGLTKNVSYHPAMPGRLDVYRPATGSGHPVVIYVYGGSWRTGNKELYAPAAQRLLPSGFVLVIPNYTLYPAAGYPRQTEEIAAAIAWTLDHIAEYGGDPGRVVLVAQSAGAHIAGLALLEPRWLAACGHSATDLRGFIGISGVYDFAAILAYHDANARAREMMAEILGGADNAGRASPITYVSPGAPPMLLIHGDADTTVPLSVGIDFYQRVRAAGVRSEFITYPGAGHADILFRALTEQPPRLINDIVGFVQRCTLPDTTNAGEPASRC
jgi:acetyl esterase/lipase